MTRETHDEFAKEYLQELLIPFGEVEKNKKVKSERREIDLFFMPNNSSQQNISNLGILENIAKTESLIEPYRNPCNEIEIRSCLLKLYTIHGEILREAKREKTSLSLVKFPFLWLLTPTCSQRILQGFEAKTPENQVQGVYFFPPLFQTGIIVIHQLPVNKDTLWLRVLGKGTTQKQAVEELVNLPQENPYRLNLLDILADWRKNLELRDNKTNEDQEVIMNLSPAYLQDREQWINQGKLEGKLEGKIEGKLETINLLIKLGLTVEQIAQELNLDISVVRNYLNQNQN